MKKQASRYREKWDKHRRHVSKLSLKDPYNLISTWFGCGTLFPGPGFWGTLGAIPLGVALMIAGGPFWLLLAAGFLFYIGLKSTKHTEKIIGEHDSSIIVIDEAAAILLVLAFTPMSSAAVLTAFLLFRFFDVLKPWPISWVDKKVSGAWGVMIDDIIAALFAIVVLLLIPPQ